MRDAFDGLTGVDLQPCLASGHLGDLIGLRTDDVR
jgi:hypothetical protein